MKSLCHKKGFTLIELIMTIVVVGIISVPLSLLVSQHVDSVFQSKDYTLALNLARLEMETVNNMSYDNIMIGSFNDPNYKGYDYDMTRTVAFAQQSGSESLKEIRLEITKSGSATVLVSLVTYLARNVSYGI